jgi:hypothetical protein
LVKTASLYHNQNLSYSGFLDFSKTLNISGISQNFWFKFSQVNLINDLNKLWKFHGGTDLPICHLEGRKLEFMQPEHQRCLKICLLFSDFYRIFLHLTSLLWLSVQNLEKVEFLVDFRSFKSIWVEKVDLVDYRSFKSIWVEKVDLVGDFDIAYFGFFFHDSWRYLTTINGKPVKNQSRKTKTQSPKYMGSTPAHGGLCGNKSTVWEAQFMWSSCT